MVKIDTLQSLYIDSPADLCTDNPQIAGTILRRDKAEHKFPKKRTAVMIKFPFLYQLLLYIVIHRINIELPREAFTSPFITS
jgi:hypothetical protein